MKASKAAKTVGAVLGVCAVCAAVTEAVLAITGRLPVEIMVDALAVAAAVGIAGFVVYVLLRRRV